VSDQRTLAVAPARLPEDVITNPPIHGAKVHGAMAAVMGEIGGVAKGRENKQQNYMFRGIADITKAAQPLLAKHGLHLVPHRVVKETKRLRETAKGGTMMHIVQRIEFRFYHQDGSWVSCETTGEAMDSGDKASNKCMSAALKYALIIAFWIQKPTPRTIPQSWRRRSSSPRPSSSRGASRRQRASRQPADPRRAPWNARCGSTRS